MWWDQPIKPIQPGLGQGFGILEKLIRQIILTLHQLTSLNDSALVSYPWQGLDYLQLLLWNLEKGQGKSWRSLKNETIFLDTAFPLDY